MSDAIELPLDDDDRLADPPLLDFFDDSGLDSHYRITFVPSDDVSAEATESVSILKQSTEGNRIAAFLGDLARLCNAKVTRISHLGGGNFTLHLTEERVISLADLNNAASIQAFDCLKQIADVAEIAFRIGNSAASPGRQRRPAI